MPLVRENTPAARAGRSFGKLLWSSRSPFLNTVASTGRCLPRNQTLARGVAARFFTHCELSRTVPTASRVP